MRQRLIAMVMGLTVFVSPVRADTVLPTDFAYGRAVEVDGSGAIYRVTLPEEVYRGVTRTDLGDVRVFNGAGEWVPHAIKFTPPTPSAPGEEALPLFPFRVPEGPERPRLDLEVITDERGAIVRVQERDGDASGSRIAGYLLDASALSQPIERLRLEWEPVEESVVAGLSVEGSDDLTNWRSLVAQATVADMRYEGRSLEVGAVPVPSARAKYLRLTWKSGSPTLGLGKVWALLGAVQYTTPREWSALAALREDAELITYAFDSMGALPVDRFEFDLGSDNTLIHGTVQSRANDQAPWRTHYKGALYHVTVQGLTLQNNPFSVPLTRDRHWRLVLDETSHAPSGFQPTLRLGWVPEELFFLAHGTAPFTLAFGSARVEPPKQSVDSVLNVLRDEQARALVKQASLAGRVELGGESALKPVPPPPPPLPWKEWVLWSVLASGVLILAALAWRLYRDMNRSAV